jgi:hypothetical protein
MKTLKQRFEEGSRSGLKVAIFNSGVYGCHTIKRDTSLSFRQMKVLKLTHVWKLENVRE